LTENNPVLKVESKSAFIKKSVIRVFERA
jgi:hypothetical protein